MEQRLEDVEARYEELPREMSSPDVASDPTRLRELGKSFAELDEIVRPYRKYKAVRQEAEEARTLAAQESDPESARYFKEEAERAESEAAKLKGELELLLVPKDPNDDKNVLVEIRAGAGGQEAALWAAELYEMYRRGAGGRRGETGGLSGAPPELRGGEEGAGELQGKGAASRAWRGSGRHREPRGRR